MKSILLCFLVSQALAAQDYSWESIPVDGRITGCQSVTIDNIELALGKISPCGTYTSPSGRKFARRSSAAKVAALVRDAQPHVSHVKNVIARSEKELPNTRQEGTLSNWAVDVLMQQVEQRSGHKVDVGILNHRGIRTGMPEGDVVLDDILSMFPFRNNIIYLQMNGKELLNVFQGMAENRFEAVGGVLVEVHDGKVTSVMVGGQPLLEDRIYGVASISFLLDGGDGLFLSRHAEKVEVLDALVSDAMLDHICHLTQAGQQIRSTDTRHVIIR